jgi:hypothetical protein
MLAVCDKHADLHRINGEVGEDRIHLRFDESAGTS